MEKIHHHPLPLLLVLVLLFNSILTSPVQAAPEIDISNAEQLNNIRNNLAGNYRLVNNIDLSTISNWVPLGNAGTPFTGSLDGAGHTINNLVVANTQSSNQGLFGVIGTAGIVNNLQIKNANITAADSAGILAGVNQGTISQVFVHGVISGANIVGGLVGTNSGSITNASVIATVTGTDNSGGLVGSNNGTLTNTYAASKVSGAVTNNYIQFDGVDDYISIPHNPAYITDSFTLEAWFQWTATDRTSVSFITGKGLENFEIHTGGGSGANGVRFIPVLRTDTTYNDLRAYQDIYNVLQPGWNHVAASWDYSNEEVRVFLNGIPQDIWQNGVNVGPAASLPLQNPDTNPLANNTEEFFIGARNDQNYGHPSLFFQGNIADVRFWNTVRTPEQIDSDKYKQLKGDEPGLIGYWKLDEANGTTVNDSSSLGNNGTLLGSATRVQESSVNGGLVAVNTGSINNSYYDSTVSGLGDTGNGTPYTTTQMKTQSSFSGWDFSTVWKIIDGSTYPSLFPVGVTINQAASQADPTNASTINFTAVFSEPIDPASFTAADLTLGGTAGASTALVSQVAPNDGTTFNIAVSGMTGMGTVTASIAADKVSDPAGNFNTASASTDNSVSYDSEKPAVTLEQATGQSDPTNASTINFTAVFSEPIDPASFTAEDLTLGGTAGASTALVSQVAPNDGTTFNIAVSGMTSMGTVTASIAADKVSDPVGNFNTASASTDNSVIYETGSPVISLSSLKLQYRDIGPEIFTISFSEAVFDPEGNTNPEDVTNPANYLLVEGGSNHIFDSLSCSTGVATDDAQIPIASVTYNSSDFTSTVRLDHALPIGNYRLFVCGTTSIVDLANNPLNHGVDSVYDFSVSADSILTSTLLPDSGFPPGQFTLLPLQTLNKSYASSDLLLEIPALGVITSIVGVPQVENQWDVSWLGNNAGYLYGSAYPTWEGNTVITGHVWNANNTPGIFADLKSLKYGDRFKIHAFGKTYTYEVRENKKVSDNNISSVFKPEVLDWVTLLTCEGFDPLNDAYTSRRMIRAVLVNVK